MSLLIIRYGEQNPCFSIATFSSDDEDGKDVSKKVTSALERVTSDYHSGSSSDEESARTSPLTIHSRCSASQVFCHEMRAAYIHIYSVFYERKHFAAVNECLSAHTKQDSW